MKVLLLSQVPAEFEVKRSESETFPMFQAQTFWMRGLKELGHQVKAIRYSDPVLYPPKTQAEIDLRLKNFNSKLFSKSRLFFNKFYRYNPQVIIRSQKIIKAINDYRPEKTIISGGISHFNSSVLKALQNVESSIYLLHGEDPLISATQFERNALNLFDWIVTNDPVHAKNWKKLGAHKTLALPYAGIDPKTHTRTPLTKEEKKRFSSDVVFVGSLFPERQQELVKLLDLPISLKVFGYVPPSGLLAPLQRVYGGEAWGDTLVKAVNGATIALNFVPPHMPYGGNMRTFEIAGCGTFQLAERCPADWFTPGKEIVLFSSLHDLKKKIIYYLENNGEREKIAKNAFKKAHNNYTYKERFKKILELP